ncbi:hypothetical protein [Streptacidiphilus monticola]|uniref:Uncharacterized protein n=1 Tax=Streptacidiphilus monticola TaxID=2161674 RepID=A0ABW1GB57_9ACTN
MGLGPRKVGPVAAAELLRLAAQVERDLLAAGIRARPYDVSGDRSDAWAGVEVEVDEFDDPAGGVWLHWKLPVELDESILLGTGEVHAPLAAGVVALLNALGYVAAPGQDSLRPYAVKVHGGPIGRDSA